MFRTKDWLIFLVTVYVVESTHRNHDDDVVKCDTQTDYIFQRTSLYVCCNGSLIENNIGEGASCCSKILYNKETHACCHSSEYRQDPITKCCRENLLNNDSQVCKLNDEGDTQDLHICNGIHYSPEHSICCNDDMYPIDGHFQCCDNQLFDTRANTCINGKVIELSLSCCGHVEIDILHQVCCSNGHGDHFPVQKSNLDHDQCCIIDSRLYNSATHECGPAGVQQKLRRISLCGSHSYDPIKDICCGDVVYVGGRTRGLQCQDILNTRPILDENDMYLLDCTHQCPFHDLQEVLHIYRCPFHAFIIKRIKSAKHEMGGHRRYQIKLDLTNTEKESTTKRQIFKLRTNCKPCTPKSKSIIILTKEAQSTMTDFAIIRNTKENRRILKNTC